MKVPLAKEPCAWHERKLSYIDWHADAERRMKAGEKQKQCPHCGRWLWPHEYGKNPNIRRRPNAGS